MSSKARRNVKCRKPLHPWAGDMGQPKFIITVITEEPKGRPRGPRSQTSEEGHLPVWAGSRIRALEKLQSGF
jgi:hypothetical protein